MDHHITGITEMTMQSFLDDDWELLNKASAQPAALTMLFQRHKDYVYRLAWGVLGNHEAAEDVVQEVFLKLGEGRLRWQPRAKFRTWLFKVALNSAREVRRRQGSEETGSEDLGQTACPHPSSDPLRVASLAHMVGALSMLPERQREVVVLRFLEGCSTRETAEIIGCREGTVKVHLHRATQILKEMLTINRFGGQETRPMEKWVHN